MKIGFSLSPGGLLLPYHLGALASLSDQGYLHESKTPLAGSSAGAIAVASQASGVPSLTALEASIRVSNKLLENPFFVATGGLLPSLRKELDQLLDPEAHLILNKREGAVALAHRELFPRNRSVLQTKFTTRNCLLDAICDSSMFPYFLTNQPVRMVRRHGRMLPRMVVDGVFACPFQRLGCPDFSEIPSEQVDRTVMISVFPTEFLSLATTIQQDLIGPALEENMVGQASRLVRMAVHSSTRSELLGLYQEGYLDAEMWTNKEDRRQREKTKRTRQVHENN